MPFLWMDKTLPPTPSSRCAPVPELRSPSTWAACTPFLAGVLHSLEPLDLLL